MNLPLNVHWNSADAMKTILDVHFQTGKILDVNHSLGVFYKKVNREVVGVDIRPMTHIQADNRALPFASDTFDVGVCDPPYRRGSSDTKYRERYGHAPYTIKRASQQYFDLLPELLRVSRHGIIIKAQDETDGHKFYSRMLALMLYMKELTNLEPCDVAYLVKTGVVDNNVGKGKGKPRHFMANCVSYFLVYRWVSKSPFRPIRFTGAAANTACTRQGGFVPSQALSTPEMFPAFEHEQTPAPCG